MDRRAFLATLTGGLLAAPLAAEAIGQTLDLIVPEPYRVAHWAGFSHAVTQGRFAKDDALLTSRALTKDGSIIAVELSAALIWSPAGQVRGIMAIGRDVTERRAREQVQHERIASLERQVAALAEGIASAAEGGATENLVHEDSSTAKHVWDADRVGDQAAQLDRLPASVHCR